MTDDQNQKQDRYKVILPHQNAGRNNNATHNQQDNSTTNESSIDINICQGAYKHIDQPMILRAVEPNEIDKFLERHKDQLEIITADNKDKQ